MSDLTIQAATMLQQNIQNQITTSVMKARAQADQAVATMLADNAKQMEATAAAAAAANRGGIDIHV